MLAKWIQGWKGEDGYSPQVTQQHCSAFIRCKQKIKHDSKTARI